MLTAVTPDHLGNGADQLLTIAGAGFDATTSVSLAGASGSAYQASSVQLDLPTQLGATFAAGSVPAEVYTVKVTHADGISASLAAAFTVTQGGQARLITNLVTPSSLGYHVASTLDLEYANSGDLAMPAPILTVTISQTHADGTTDQKAFLTLDSCARDRRGSGVRLLLSDSATRSRSWPAARHRGCWSRANRSRCQSTMRAGRAIAPYWVIWHDWAEAFSPLVAKQQG